MILSEKRLESKFSDDALVLQVTAEKVMVYLHAEALQPASASGGRADMAHFREVAVERFALHEFVGISALLAGKFGFVLNHWKPDCTHLGIWDAIVKQPI